MNTENKLDTINPNSFHFPDTSSINMIEKRVLALYNDINRLRENLLRGQQTLVEGIEYKNHLKQALYLIPPTVDPAVRSIMSQRFATDCAFNNPAAQIRKELAHKLQSTKEEIQALITSLDELIMQQNPDTSLTRKRTLWIKEQQLTEWMQTNLSPIDGSYEDEQKIRAVSSDTFLTINRVAKNRLLHQQKALNYYIQQATTQGLFQHHAAYILAEIYRNDSEDNQRFVNQETFCRLAANSDGPKKVMLPFF